MVLAWASFPDPYEPGNIEGFYCTVKYNSAVETGKNVDVETFDGIALLIQFHTLLCTVTSRFYGWLSLRDQVFSFSWSNKKFHSSIADDIPVWSLAFSRFQSRCTDFYSK